MKRVLAFILAFMLVFCNFGAGFVESNSSDVATPTDLTPAIEQVIEQPGEPEITEITEPEEQQPPQE